MPYSELEPEPDALIPVEIPDNPLTGPASQFPGLSQREREVLDLIEAGLTFARSPTNWSSPG
jgi:ATP/maltotriose-dependent transcriptional regulator MalT